MLVRVIEQDEGYSVQGCISQYWVDLDWQPKFEDAVEVALEVSSDNKKQWVFKDGSQLNEHDSTRH